jgi:hypothetical protein
MNLQDDQIEDIPFTGPSKISKDEYFIRGPIPVWWVRIATEECRPTALSLGLILFQRQGMNVGKRPITVNEQELFGIKRWSKTEALQDLAKARLITLEQRGQRLIPSLDLKTRKPAL